MTINKRMKAVRKALRMTQEEFGKRLGITYAAVSMTERELNGVSGQNIQAMVREFHVNEEWLKTGEGEMFSPVLSRDDVAAFTGDIMKDEDDFRLRFISALAKLTPEEWKILKNKILEIAGEINKAAQRRTAFLKRNALRRLKRFSAYLAEAFLKWR